MHELNPSLVDRAIPENMEGDKSNNDFSNGGVQFLRPIECAALSRVLHQP